MAVWSRDNSGCTHDGCTSQNSTPIRLVRRKCWFSSDRYAICDLPPQASGRISQFRTLPFTLSLASTARSIFSPPAKTRQLSRVPATALGKDMRPYIKRGKPTAFRGFRFQRSTIWANELMKLDRFRRERCDTARPARATSAAALGRRQPVSLRHDAGVSGTV